MSSPCADFAEEILHIAIQFRPVFGLVELPIGKVFGKPLDRVQIQFFDHSPHIQIVEGWCDHLRSYVGVDVGGFLYRIPVAKSAHRAVRAVEQLFHRAGHFELNELVHLIGRVPAKWLIIERLPHVEVYCVPAFTARVRVAPAAPP